MACVWGGSRVGGVFANVSNNLGDLVQEGPSSTLYKDFLPQGSEDPSRDMSLELHTSEVPGDQKASPMRAQM